MATLLKTVKKTGILMAGCIALAAFSSCANDTYSDGRDINTIIGFEITSGDEGSPKSRAPQQTEGTSRLLYAPHSKDSLFLHTTISDNTLPAEENKKTRGIPVDSANFKEVCKEFGVKAYIDGTDNLYMDAKVSSENNGVWTPDGGPRFWPGTQTLDFYACAPYGYKDSVNCNNKSISIDYTVPKSATTDEDAKAQPDLMFALASCNVESVNGKGCVPLTFKHALAAIQFKAHENSIGTIKSIKIKNAQGSGNCTYDGKTFVWKLKGEPREYTQDFNVDVDKNSLDVTAKMPEATFMMIPQDLKDISIEVAFVKEDSTTHTLEGKLGNNMWEPGKRYTYNLHQSQPNP